jgi:hypothetical protein
MKIFLSGVDVQDGQLHVRDISNGAGNFATVDPTTRQFRERTTAQTLADIGAQAELDIISLAELNAGTATTERSVNSKNLNDWLSGKIGGSNGYTEESFTYVASNTFTLSQSNPMAINVYIHGQRKRPGLDYTVSGNQITFLDTLQASFDIKVTYFYSIPGVSLSGSGTANYIPKWTGASSLSDSILQESGTNLLISGNTAWHSGNFTPANYGLTTADITAVSLSSTTLTLTRAAGNLTASVPTFNQNTTGSAATLTTARTLTIGSTGKTFNGSANVSWSLAEIGAEAAFTTLSIAKGGTGLSALGTANQLLRVNAGATALEYFTPSFLTAAITSLNGLTASSQTFANDTNVTITSATSTHTIGWSGQLSVSRGGTGASTLTGVLIGNGTSAVTAVAGTASQLLRRNAGNTAYEFFTPTYLTAAITSLNGLTSATQTFANDTNVTVTSATSTHTIGWSGQLSVSRGGTGASTLTGVLVGNGTSAVTAVAGTASQLLRRNAGNTAYEFFTQTLTTISDVTITSPTNGQVLTYNGTAWVNSAPSGGGTITGSGTTNYITKWTGTTAIGNSILFDNGTNVMIGTTTDGGQKLQVVGNVYSSGDYQVTNGKGLWYDASNIVKQNTSHGWQISSWLYTDFVGRIVVSSNIEAGGQMYSIANAKGNSGTGTVTFNWDDGNVQTVTLTGNCTFAFSNPKSGASYQIIITQDGTGSRTITWPTVHWEGKTTPTLTGTASSKDIVTITYDGTNYNGIMAKNFGTP